MITASDVILACSSHRAREKLFALLPTRPAGYWSMDRRCAGGYYKVAVRDVPDPLPKGVTRARAPYSDLAPCW